MIVFGKKYKPVFGEVASVGTKAVMLGDYKCDWVKIQSRLKNADNTDNGSILMFGDAGIQSGEVTPGTWSDYIPCENLSDLRVKSAGDPQTVAFYIGLPVE